MNGNQWNNPAINPVGNNGMSYFNNNPTSMNYFPRYEVIQVNGENGVDAFQMGPNSSILLLDKTAPIVWFVQTDGAGYKSKTPYDITPHQAMPPVDINSLEQRIQHLEEIIDAKQSDSRTAKPKKPRANTQQPTDAVD